MISFFPLGLMDARNLPVFELSETPHYREERAYEFFDDIPLML